MTTNIIISNQTNPYLNLAVENHLLKTNNRDTISMFLWKNRHTVVIGANQNPFSECDLDKLIGDGGFLARRNTGGGAVYHDLGNINFSFVAHQSNFNILKHFSVIQNALRDYGLETSISGRNDLTFEGRKFSGNAFSNSKSNCLHHGTLLIKSDMEKISRYRIVKPVKLMKHGVKSVANRIINLSEVANITSDNIMPHLIDAFENIYENKANILDFEELSNIPEVQRTSDLYGSEKFLYGKWRSFNANYSFQYDWGNVEIAMTIDEKKAVITSIEIASDSLYPDAINQTCELLTGASILTPPSTDNAIIRDIIKSLYEN